MGSSLGCRNLWSKSRSGVKYICVLGDQRGIDVIILVARERQTWFQRPTRKR